MAANQSERRLASSLAEITRLLDRHRVLETMAHQQDSPKRDLLEQLQHRQNVAELGKRLRGMHAADIAFVLEALPPDDRTTVWEQVAPDQAGDVFVEASDAVRRFSGRDRIDRARSSRCSSASMPEDLAFVSASLPQELQAQVVGRARIVRAHDLRGQHPVRHAVGGPLHDPRMGGGRRPPVRSAMSLDELRERGALPPQTDHVFVVDARHVLRGIIPLPVLLVQDPAVPVAGLTSTRTSCRSSPTTKPTRRSPCSSATTWFPRRCVDDRGKLVGRLTVDAVDGRDARRVEPAGAAQRGPQSGRRSVRVVVGQRAQPLAVAGDQPRHRVHCLARDRPVRRRDPATGRAGGADADRREHRRQYRQPDDGAGDPRRSRPTRSQPERGAASAQQGTDIGVVNGSVWGLSSASLPS